MKTFNSRHGPGNDTGYGGTLPFPAGMAGMPRDGTPGRPRDGTSLLSASYLQSPAGTERRPRDETTGKPRDGTTGKPRDGTAGKSRDGTVKMPRDAVIRSADGFVTCHEAMLAKLPRDILIRGKTRSRWRKNHRGKPGLRTGNGRGMPWPERQ
jgi:hypothetical protein